MPSRFLTPFYQGAGILFAAPDEHGHTRVLLGKRLWSPGAGQWSIIGGQVDASDLDFPACAAREAREETGASQRVLGLDRSLQESLSKAAHHRLHIPCIFDWRTFLLQLPRIPPPILWPRQLPYGTEFSHLAWFAVDNWPRPMAWYTKQTLEYLLQL